MQKFMGVWIFLTVIFISSAAIAYEVITDHQPQIGMENTVYLGDRMLLQRVGQFKECIVPQKNIRVGDGTYFEFLANKPLCKLEKDSEYYIANYTLSGNCRGIEGQGTCGSFVASKTPVNLVKDGETFELQVGMQGMFGMKFPNYWKAKLNSSELKVDDEWFLYQENSFQQTIEYSGKNGNIIKFIYSEFTGDMIREAFTREFQIDLSEDSIVAYKGAIIEILKATNSIITYKVVRNFQS